MRESFEEQIRELTKPVNGEYPRPWMTSMKKPQKARVLIVGRNQAKSYPVEKVGSHDQYIDSLFKRNGETCRAVYDKVTDGKGSGARSNINELVRRLNAVGIHDVLETNVICYSTRMSA